MTVVTQRSMIVCMITVKSLSLPPQELGYEVWRSDAGVMLSFNHIERQAHLTPSAWRLDNGSLRFELAGCDYALPELPEDAIAVFVSAGILVVEFSDLGPVAEHWARQDAA